MRSAPFERYFPGLQKMTCQNFAMTSSKGSKLRSKVNQIFKFLLWPKMALFWPLNPKNEKFYFFSSFRGKKSHCTGKIRFYAQKMFNRKFEIFRTLSDEKKFTFWAITSVLVGIFQICLHIWKLEKKCNRMCVNRFFLSSRESGQNRTRRSKFWITIFRQPKVLKIGPPRYPLVVKNFKK